jgi:hypothetical protein
MMPDWNAISTRVRQIIEVLHLGDEPLACTTLDHCQRRAAGEPADEAGEDQLIEFAANYGQSLDWIVLGDLDPTIRRLSAIGHNDDDPAVMVGLWWSEAAPMRSSARIRSASHRRVFSRCVASGQRRRRKGARAGRAGSRRALIVRGRFRGIWGDATPQRGVRPDVLRWPAINRGAAGGSHSDQEVFDTDRVLFDKAELQETMMAGAALRPVDDAFTLDVMPQQLGVGHWRLGIFMSPAAYFVSLW